MCQSATRRAFLSNAAQGHSHEKVWPLPHHNHLLSSDASSCEL